MSDPPSRNDEVRELVAACVAALERGEGDPVAGVCRDAPELARAVRERLARLRSMGLVDDSPGHDTLESFGPYRVIERLGSGGMGTVWLAEQTTPVTRRVALKVVKLGMDSAEVLARFEAERQALARLSHPNIARIFDAGIVPGGRPYFAMELVDGTAITTYADDRTLTTAQRVELLLPVCDAVQHAHQRGVIHRDLKPSNILVAERDGAAAPVVIDFGVAKALDDGDVRRTLLTGHGQVLGTPEYMSPEQAEGHSAAVDVRTDVYALGVVLYELLTGSLPIPSDFAKLAPTTRLATLAEFEPPAPSARVSALAQRDSIAIRRHTTALALRRRLRGELDWIALKALARERDRRYASMNAMADDLRRHLRGETVAAVPPGRAYLLRKTVRRHRVAAALAVSVFTGMAAALTGIGLGLREARTQTKIAEANFGDALDTVDQLLVRASQLRLDGVPHATEIETGFRRDALRALERLLARKPESTDLRSRVARATFDLAQGVSLLGNGAEATALAEKARAALRRLRDESLASPETLTALGKTCRLLLERYTWTNRLDLARDAGDEAKRVFADLGARFPDEPLYSRLTASLFVRYANMLSRSGDTAGYESHLREALRLREELAAREPTADEHQQALVQSLHTVALLHGQRGDFERASELAQRALDIASAVSSRDPSRDKRRAHGLAASLAAMIDLDAGNGDRAEQRWRAARNILAGLVEDYPGVTELRHELAQPTYYLAARLADRWSDEPALFDEVVALLRDGVAANRAALAERPEDRRYLAWQRQLSQFLALALDEHPAAPPAEIATLRRELERIPATPGTERHLSRHRHNLSELRAVRGIR